MTKKGTKQEAKTQRRPKKLKLKKETVKDLSPRGKVAGGLKLAPTEAETYDFGCTANICPTHNGEYTCPTYRCTLVCSAGCY